MLASTNDTSIFKSRHFVGVYTGLGKHIIKDDIISPLIYKGSKAPIGLTYSLQKVNSIQNLSIFFDKTVLKSSISNSWFSPYTNNLNAILNYSYNRRTYSNSKLNTDLYLGGKFSWNICYREHYYNSYFNEISGEQLTGIGLNMILVKNFQNSNDKMFFKFSVPILAYSAFNSRFNTVVGEATEDLDGTKNIYWQLMQNGQFVTLNNLQEFQSTIYYTKLLWKNFGFSLKYHLHFYKLVQYKDVFYVRHLNNQFTIGLIIKTGK